MSEIVVRPYESRDQEQTWHVRAMTYNSGRPVPLEQQVYKTAAPFVGEIDGKIVGAIGVSGGSSAQDGVAAKAGADSLPAPAAK